MDGVDDVSAFTCEGSGNDMCALGALEGSAGGDMRASFATRGGTGKGARCGWCGIGAE